MPGKTVADIRAELEALVRPFAAAGRLGFELRIEQEREPFETPPEDDAVRAVIAAAQRVTGATPKIVGRRIVGDANLYVHGTGIPTFYYGASNHTAHADVEWVSVDRIRRSAQVYLAAAAAYCGVAT
jgi:acetylornithine deacetylase/succinyl-diaminopimelate desuccinylase-like protein